MSKIHHGFDGRTDCSRDTSRDKSDLAFPPVVITAAEFQAAKLFWIKRIQNDLFIKEINSLSLKKAVPANSSIFALRPFLDADGIIRVGGRLNHAPFPFAFRYPILLASHPLVTLIVDQAHWRSLHSGVQLTLNILRREFWLLRGRSIVKNIIHRCITCARERAAIPTQLMGNLPQPRVSTSVRNFLHCGLDYAGPVLISASAGRGTQGLYSTVRMPCHKSNSPRIGLRLFHVRLPQRLLQILFSPRAAASRLLGQRDNLRRCREGIKKRVSRRHKRS